jgi:VWFA-related protein
MRLARVFLIIIGGSAWLSAQVMIPVYQVVVDKDPVAVNVIVSDSAGHTVNGLTKENFAVLEDDEVQSIREIRPVGIPYNMLILVDRSVREKKSPWPDLILKSVDRLFKSMRGPDRLAVGLFDTRVSVVLDWRRSRSGVRQNVFISSSDRGTQFFSAVDWALDELRNVKGPKGVIMYTDGRDISMYPRMVTLGGQLQPEPNYTVSASAEARFQQTLVRVKESQIPFYFVAIDTDRQLTSDSATFKLPGWVSFLAAARIRMEKLAAASGGSVIFPRKADEVVPFYRQIQNELGSGYIVSYSPTQPGGDSHYRHIEVRVQQPSTPCVIEDGKCTIDVRARIDPLQVTQAQLGYYAR